ncbi:MAG: phenylacetate--CoA ligase family protein [Acidobacteria bacterium]|nr:phenylacetate--CoA ligase family protein [Acidobacteriota bacterium]
MLHSAIRHRLALKAIDLGRHTEIAKFLPVLEQSQWHPAESLAQSQIVRLQQILAFASQHVPFYMRLFAQNKWHPGDFGTVSDLDRLPIITKEILRSAPCDFMPHERKFRSAYKSRHTGGSTGEPLSYRVANDAFGMKWAATFRVWQATGYTFGDRMHTLGGASLDNRQRNGISQNIYNFLRNNHSIPVGQLHAADLSIIETQLNAARPSILYGYPSILYLVACHILRRRTVIQSIKRIVTTSELLFPGQRKVIEQAFEAPVYDEYGCPEAGLIAGECNYHQGLHYAMELCLVEPLGDDNARLPIGCTGRLVATNLLNRAMCLIRYDTGDIGAIAEGKCECGRGLLRIINLEGRSRDLIYTPSKGIIHGVAINHIIYGYPWIDRYQIIQDTPRDLKLNLSVSKVVDPACVEQLRSRLSEYADMAVTITINGPFIETKGKKNRLIISKVPVPDESE